MRHQVTLGPPGKNRHAEGQQQILQDAEIALHRLAPNLAFPRHLGKIEQRAVRKTDGLKKTGKRTDIAYQRLGLHLFTQIE